jgi:mutator protein MutT
VQVRPSGDPRDTEKPQVGRKTTRHDLSYKCGEERKDLIRVVAALIERKGRLLICQRRREDIFGLKWEFPGGKLRPSETPRAGIVRELREELGSAARIGRQVYRARHRYQELGEDVEISFFSACEMVPAPQNLAFERMVWARPADLAGYDFLAANGALVARLARGELKWQLRTESSARRPRPAPGR